jgi:hypothetical protein
MTRSRTATSDSDGMRTIVWDVDDVLNAFTREWLGREWLPRNPACKLGFDDLRRNPPHELLGISLDEYLQSIDRFRESPAGRALPPSPDVRAWFENYGARFRHVALTARPLASAPAAAEWVLENFGRWVRAFGFIPSPRADPNIPQYDSTKASWLAWMRAGDIFVDDSPINIAIVARLGLATVEVPQPWNAGLGSLNDALRQILTLDSE